MQIECEHDFMVAWTIESVNNNLPYLVKSLSKSTTYTWLKGHTGMLPWHAIPFLKDLGMLTPNPWENRWPRLWRSCKWQKNAQLTHSIAPKEPNRRSNGRTLVRYWCSSLRSGALHLGCEAALNASCNNKVLFRNRFTIKVAIRLTFLNLVKGFFFISKFNLGITLTLRQTQWEW